ncbi:MAG: 7,8-dihydro-6-hydroxymethylpterin-pyrophosphokinase [Pelagibacteraceae bacterium BACL5 MAG-120705-bin12]|uniref:2-amino-4-hydroxy-6- hydroxymethyldihydropteridine diphosphokinase n=1 Tax=Candidatus Pelagibacter sp. TaxID=2024849 RepID=UPI000714A7FB|nr:MAG: 7,8-dihydro-6-hydroxymethylpterin-pyrophosphokinase [Pelagibacteraceae bacterium BACL5 MAG-121015-bin10]KRO61288.1 MAG: 7,8-dihydro-6-hydroxymethylpterin-pyrophosphokinase [Pelagibacteraceae bacterium BACL5 MAG-121128-bin54]KRO61726.1 MAG: 7,8-dihydro-6-hydroxymethylpterin-pyrophosphokinase [Pelagibacteraceae bacterium BACL5 MAG-120705-bin12]KRO65432.1 MAG: 7,8-dihydro-6-hydroxymethylpterin-pyrophosphokinase [Pelagibacteraceae bacterium BACL5 MAG-120820-bin39]MDA1166935.1 2-amino-4-hydr
MIKQGISENQVKLVYLGIGSNLGNKFLNIEKAKSYLYENNIQLINSSSYYETPSWPNPRFPKFINIIVKIRTKLDYLELFYICKKIETKLGRKNSPKNSPRICDIDIIDFDNKIIKKEIQIPHKLMHIRNFVLFPLFEIDKNWKHPVLKKNIKKLIFSLPIKDIRSIKQI